MIKLKYDATFSDIEELQSQKTGAKWITTTNVVRSISNEIREWGQIDTIKNENQVHWKISTLPSKRDIWDAMDTS